MASLCQYFIWIDSKCEFTAVIYVCLENNRTNGVRNFFCHFGDIITCKINCLIKWSKN